MNHLRKHPSDFSHKSSGSALLWMVILFMLVGGLMSTLGSLTLKSKVMSGKSLLGNRSVDAAVMAVIGFTRSNKRLPTLGTEFDSAVSNSTDTWNQDFGYVYDSDASTTTSVCSHTTTNIIVNGVPNIAFVILSGGNNYNIQTTKTTGTWSGAEAAAVTITTATKGVNSDGYTGADDPAGVAVRSEPYDDIVRWVTLTELQARIRCDLDEQSGLQIFNTSLPKTQERYVYSGTIMATGGIPFTADEYDWCFSGSKPSSLSMKTSAAAAVYSCSSPSTRTDYIKLSGSTVCGDAGTYPITFEAVDENPDPTQNTASKVLNLYVENSLSCDPVYPEIQDFNDPKFPMSEPTSDAIVKDDANKTINLSIGATESGVGCLWSVNTKTISSVSKVRSYFRFKNTITDTSLDSSNQGGGFTFALVDGTVATDSCGLNGADLGFGGLKAGTPPATTAGSVAVEFDLFKEATKNDPDDNHLGVVLKADNDHGSTANPDCNVDTGCVSTAAVSTINWLEDNEPHEARIELHGDGISRYKSCGAGEWLVLAWVDCSGCSELDNLGGNYTSEKPKIMHCFDPTDAGLSMGSSVRFGFTHAIAGAGLLHYTTLSHFGITFATRDATRYEDNGDGTVTDHATGLISLKNTQCWDSVNLGTNPPTLGAPATMYGNWTTATDNVAALKDGSCDLSDGSSIADWRFLKKDELALYADWTTAWTNDKTLFYLSPNKYWSDTEDTATNAWNWDPGSGVVSSLKTQGKYGWPIKDVIVGRYVDNGDGTITDNATDLIILENATCLEGSPPVRFYGTWTDLVADVDTLVSGECGLTDGSIKGEWALLTKNTLAYYDDWQSSTEFENVVNNVHWSSTEDSRDSNNAWSVNFSAGDPEIKPKTNSKYGWPIRRYIDQGNGTVKDTFTDLIILKNSVCYDGVNPASWYGTWTDLTADIALLANGDCDLTDGSKAGEWALPPKSMLSYYDDWKRSSVFKNVQNNTYWLATEDSSDSDNAWSINFSTEISAIESKSNIKFGWPIRRFVDNGDGTVTDNVTNLIILEDSVCLEGAAPAKWYGNWSDLTDDIALLADGDCGLSDGSSAGHWRLPTQDELSYYEDWKGNALFSSVQNNAYWSSTEDSSDTSNAWSINFSTEISETALKTQEKFGWPVRDP